MSAGTGLPIWSRPRKAKRKMPAPVAFGMSDAWRSWAVENLLRGVPEPQVLAVLSSHGIPAVLAAREVNAMVRSPIFAGARRVAAMQRRLALVCALRRQLAPRQIERRTAPAADEFFARYFATNTPVLLTDATKGSRALTTWSPAWFKAELGDEPIEITSGREADPDFDPNFKAHCTDTTFAAFVDRMLAAGTTNDFYLIANNRTLERPAMRRLFDDVVVDEGYFDRARLAGGSSLWMGPAGTRTSLHHDTTNILFCQVYGKKRVRLASPLEPSFLERLNGVYNAIDLDEPAPTPDREEAVVYEMEVVPGDALFIPVGWWHEVLALDVSISVSLTCFRLPNSFDWYVPGVLRGDAG